AENNNSGNLAVPDGDSISQIKQTQYTLIDNQYGGGFQLQYPFSTFTRAQLNLSATAIVRDSMVAECYETDIFRDRDNDNIKEWISSVVELGPENTYRYTKKTILPEISFVNDNTIYGMHGPVNGRRLHLSLLLCPPVSGINDFGFVSLSADMRKYFHFRKKYGLAIRFVAGLSSSIGQEENPQQFYLGASKDELKNLFYIRYYGTAIEDVYFSRYIAPLRGWDFDERQGGDRVALGNIEIRTPMLRDISFDWPLEFAVTNIRFALFTDIGGTWRGEQGFKAFEKLPANEAQDKLFSFRYRDLLQGMGYGFRMRLGYFILRYDIAWKYDLTSFSKPYSYLSIGADF
ncbi:MAG: BamA/TamA family outer membrane protein, partial [bacterium]